jgi:hypothetical protein
MNELPIPVWIPAAILGVVSSYFLGVYRRSPIGRFGLLDDHFGTMSFLFMLFGISMTWAEMGHGAGILVGVICAVTMEVTARRGAER